MEIGMIKCILIIHFCSLQTLETLYRVNRQLNVEAYEDILSLLGLQEVSIVYRLKKSCLIIILKQCLSTSLLFLNIGLFMTPSSF